MFELHNLIWDSLQEISPVNGYYYSFLDAESFETEAYEILIKRKPSVYGPESLNFDEWNFFDIYPNSIDLTAAERLLFIDLFQDLF